MLPRDPDTLRPPRLLDVRGQNPLSPRLVPPGRPDEATADTSRPSEPEATPPTRPQAARIMPPQAARSAGLPAAPSTAPHLVPLAPRPAPGAALPPRLPARPSRAAGPVYRGLPWPVRLVLWVVTVIVVGAVLGATAPTALRRIGAVAALQPGLLAWYTARIMGFLAYLVVAAAVLYGLLLSTKILDAIAHRPVSFALHKDLSIAGLLLGTIHGTVLLADQSFAFTPRAIIVPFASPYAAVPVGIGQLTFYGLLIVTASFYVRRQIGQRAWRILHYLTFAVFVGATSHGLMSGSDSGTPWAFWVYLIPSAAAVFLLVYRIVLSISLHALHPKAERSALPPLIARAPLPNSGGRVPSGRPTAPIEPPSLAGTFD